MQNITHSIEKPARLRIPTAALAAISAASVALHAAATDSTPLIAWGGNVDGAAQAPDPAYNEAFGSIAMGDYHGIAILATGTSVRGWGRNTAGQITIPNLTDGSTYEMVAAGSNHTALLKSGGTIVCYGLNTSGQCTVPAHGFAFDMVRCGSDFTLARDLQGDIVAWGDDSSGQSTVPALGGRADDFAGGLDHAVALRSDGTIVFWGDNGSGEQTQPTIPSGFAVQQVACGWNTTAFLFGDGSVQVVGDSTFQQTNASAANAGVNLAIRAHGFTIGTRRANGSIVVWGNTSNQLDQTPSVPASTRLSDFDLGFGVAAAVYRLDCDSNGVDDLLQIQLNPSADCNGDFRVDSCEIAEKSFSGATTSPFSAAAPYTLTIPDAPTALMDVAVEIDVRADLGSAGESLSLTLNGQFIDYVFLQGGENCPASLQSAVVSIPRATFNAALQNGDAVFTITASSLVSAAECPNSSITMRVRYAGGSIDCNLNGTPDVCEVDAGTVADDDGDGIPDTCQRSPIGDLDADRKSDIVLFKPSTRRIVIWFMNGLTRRGGAVVPDVVPDGYSFGGMGDLDGDGSTDLVFRNLGTGQILGLLMNGGTPVQVGTLSGTVSTAYTLLAVADINGDGTDDLIWRRNSNDQVTAWRMQGLVRIGGGVVGTAAGLAFLGAGDLNADDKADLLWRDTAGNVTGWLLNGNTILSQGAIANAPAVPPAFGFAGMADLDGDEKSDIVWRNIDTGLTTGWLMDGLSRRQGGTITSTVSLQFNIAGLADLNGDSKWDIIWRNTTNGNVNGWLMNGLQRTAGGFVRNVGLDWRIVNP